MKNMFIPKLDLQANINETRINTFNPPIRLEAMATSPEVPGFTDVMSGLLKEVDTTMKAPDQILDDAILGNGADIHDVMLAMSKAEVSLNIATQVTTKVIQAYEKVISIQV